MRLKFIASAVAALAAVFGIHSAAQADCGGCGASAVVACCPAADCCQPKVRYKREWQTVVEQRTRTCYKTVSETVMKEVCEVVCRPVHEQKEVVCKRIVCEPVWQEKQVKVCCGEWVYETRTSPCQTVCKKVRVQTCNDNCNPCGNPCDSGCGHKGHGGHGLFGKREYAYVQETIPGKTTCCKVWKPREEIRTVKTCQMVPREIVEKKMVTTCRMERHEVKKMVPVTVCKRVPYCVTENVCKKVRVCVPVCDDRGGHKLFGGLFHRSNKCGCEKGCGHAPCGGCGHAPGHIVPAPAGGPTAAPMPAPAPAPVR